MAMDPVCKMEVEEESAQWAYDYEGETYYFCSPGCMTAFREAPEKYLGGGGGHDEHEHHHH